MLERHNECTKLHREIACNLPNRPLIWISVHIIQPKEKKKKKKKKKKQKTFKTNILIQFN